MDQVWPGSIAFRQTRRPDRRGATRATAPRTAQTTNETHYFSGWYRLGDDLGGGNRSSVSGAVAWINNYSPWVYPGTRATAFTMLQQYYAPTTYAQVGWNEMAYSHRSTLWEVSEPGHTRPIVQKFIRPGRPVNEFSGYDIVDDGYKFYAYVNHGNTWDQVGWEWQTFTANQANSLGEILSRATQMPGGYRSPEWSSSTQVWIDGHSGWEPFNGTALAPGQGNDNSNWFGQYVSDPSTMSSWDWACAY